jgi:hypothetical protein
MKLALTLLPSALLLFAIACEDTTPPVPCRDIPIGGCPAANGDPCFDKACLNAFDCVGGTWKFNHACTENEAGAPVDAGADASLSPFDAAGFDAPPGAFGGPGCPTLQTPDCPLGAALSCSASDCCGCVDLFVCASGGWNAWGTCSADAGVQAGG